MLDSLKTYMANSFNIYNDFVLNNHKFDFMGEFVLTNNHYFISKKNVVWGYENREYVFARELDSLSSDYLQDYIMDFAEIAMDKMVNPTENHMSTHITVLLCSSNIDEKLKKEIKKYKKRKSFKLGLRGFSALRIILFDNVNKEFIYNRESKDVINFYRGVLQ